jgi:FkbM family methyltransferase
MAQRVKTPFVLASTAHGPVILNHLDFRQLDKGGVELGVGLDILVHGEFDLPLISMTCGALEIRRRERGAGVVALDCGANIGIYTLEWARRMEGWGRVLAFEPQERIYYALAGNIALNNLFNAQAINSAIGAKRDVIDMRVPDYCVPGQFGGLSLNGRLEIGQEVTTLAPLQVIPIDDLGLRRVDFIKLDIEGMEPDALAGARKTIETSKPFMLVEWIKCGKEPIEAFMASVSFETVTLGMNLLCGPAGNEFTARMRELSEQRAVPQ